MNYYRIWVNDPSYKGKESLTYEFDGLLKNGNIVVVPFRAKTVLGIVESKVTKPGFKSKAVLRVIGKELLPKQCLDLIDWLLSYYPSSKSTTLHLFLANSLINIKEVAPALPGASISDAKLPKLTAEQTKAVNQINNSKDRSIILHGDTGSGKTRVYIELAAESIAKGKSVVILTPEIGLTPQLVKTLEDSFAGQVVVMHSALTPKQRATNWLKILETTTPLIVIGPRSALFSPIKNIGLIVIDEAHESVYKQEQAPRYQTTRVAAKLAELHGSKLILGSATPLISDYYFMQSKGSPVVRMEGSARKGNALSHKASIEIVKIGDKSQFNRSYWLSDNLIKSISTSLKNNEQSLVFLNRRGTALIIHCKNCGWDALCPNCDTNLTYHADTHLMRCHSCNYSNRAPSLCPVCRSEDIVFSGVGTKAIALELEKMFPTASISRFDRDNKVGEKLSENYEDLLSGKIDIIIGTQILTKGFDLPKLSTVGVVMADSGLYFPDYSAEERTYQTLTQVIGRVARGHRPGNVVIQTYNPGSPAIKAATDRDYLEFYNSQIKERKQFFFPPFCYLLKISCHMASSDRSRTACEKLANDIRQLGVKVTISGPSPAFKEKDRGKYVWQVIVRAVNRPELVKIIDSLGATWTYDIDPNNLL